MRRGLRSSSSTFKRKGLAGLDLLYIVIVLFSLSIAFIYFGQAFNTINDEMQSDDELSVEAKEAVDFVNDSYINTFDGLIAFLFFGMLISVMITSWFLDSHPVFFVISLIILAVVLFPTVILANTFEELATASDISDVSVQFSYCVWIISHIVELLCITAFMVFVLMYGKSRTGGF